MSLFSRKKTDVGWLGMHFTPEGIVFARVQRMPDKKPMVTLCMAQSLEKGDRAKIADLVKKLHLEKYRGTLVLNADEYQMLMVEAPNVPADELKSTVRWRIKDMLHFPVDDAIVDLLEIPLDKNSVSRSRSLLAVAGRADAIRRYVTALDTAKCPLEAVDVPELAQRNIAGLVEEEGRGLALLSFDESGGLLTFTFMGELYATRHIDIPLSNMQTADSEQRQRYFDRIALELQRSFDNFERQFSHISLSKLMLAALPDEVNLEAYLASNLYIPVSTLDLSEVFDFSRLPNVTPAQRQRGYYALGAALRDEFGGKPQ